MEFAATQDVTGPVLRQQHRQPPTVNSLARLSEQDDQRPPGATPNERRGDYPTSDIGARFDVDTNALYQRLRPAGVR